MIEIQVARRPQGRHASNHLVTVAKRSVTLHKVGYNFPALSQVSHAELPILEAKLNPQT